MRVARRITLALTGLAIVAMSTVAGVAWQHGYRVYVVHTGSMMPTLQPGDAVLDRPAHDVAVKPGEIVTFAVQSGSDSVVTHRVRAFKNGLITTKGDANATPDTWGLRPSQVVGRVLATLPHAGYALVFLQQPQGIASIATGGLGLVLLWGLFFPSDASRNPEATTP